MKRPITLVIALLHFAVSAPATILINFDTDADGTPLKAPSLFIDTVRLTELYAPLGIHFMGPPGNGGHDGGAILNQEGNFGVDAHSGANFLAFNRGRMTMDHGIARDPETITFDTLASNVSIFAAGPIAETFLMQGFDINGILIASDMVTTQNWSELEISSATGIKSVTLFVTGPNDQGIPLYFVYDDLSVDFVPEPSAIALLACAGVALLYSQFRRRHRRNKVT